METWKIIVAIVTIALWIIAVVFLYKATRELKKIERLQKEISNTIRKTGA